MKTTTTTAMAAALAGQAMPIQHDPLAWSPRSDVALTVAIILGALVVAALLGAAIACVATLAEFAASVGRQLHHGEPSAGRPTAAGSPSAGPSAAKPSSG